MAEPWPVTPGVAARVRRWYFEAVANVDAAPATPELRELLDKARLLEGVLPILAPVIGLRGIRSIADLLPDTDDEASFFLELVHDWTGRMLERAGDDIAEELPPKLARAVAADELELERVDRELEARGRQAFAPAGAPELGRELAGQVDPDDVDLDNVRVLPREPMPEPSLELVEPGDGSDGARTAGTADGTPSESRS